MHVSLDGFVAGPKGEMNWINANEEVFDLAGKATANSDTAMYGRVTYEMMNSYWPTAGNQLGASRHDIEHADWYNRVTKIVISRSMKDHHIPNTRIVGSHLIDEVLAIKNEPGGDILIFGSPTASKALMAANLIDEYSLMVNPVLLGKGIPLFANISGHVKLKNLEMKKIESGVVFLRYETV